MNVNMKTVIMVSTVLTAAGVMWGATTGTLGTVFLKKSDAQTTYVTKEIYAHDNAAISRRLDDIQDGQKEILHAVLKK